MTDRLPRSTAFLSIAALSLVLWLILAGFARYAFGQATAMTSCSQTVGASAAPVPFPAAGAHGAVAPKNYLQICNAHASNNLGVNVVGGAASIGAADTLTLNPGGCSLWEGPAVPSSASVIGSGAGTTTACFYH